MDDITNVIANNLQSIRKERQLTLQDLSELTGVSKSMLGEIERGSSNPTITVLWKISTGLKISISKLIHENKPVCHLVHEDQWRILHNLPTHIALIFEADQNRNFEVYYMEFQAHSIYESSSHDRGVVEYLMVYEGEFTMMVNNERFVLTEGDSLTFNADVAHSYYNNSNSISKAYSLIYYPNT